MWLLNCICFKFNLSSISLPENDILLGFHPIQTHSLPRKGRPVPDIECKPTVSNSRTTNYSTNFLPQFWCSLLWVVTHHLYIDLPFFFLPITLYHVTVATRSCEKFCSTFSTCRTASISSSHVPFSFGFHTIN